MRARDADRDDRDAVLLGDDRGAGAQAAELAGARARALGEDQEVPALVDQPVDVVEGAVAGPPPPRRMIGTVLKISATRLATARFL